MLPILIPVIRIAGKVASEYVLTKSGLLYDDEEAIENIDEDVNRIESTLANQEIAIENIDEGVNRIESTLANQEIAIENVDEGVSRIEYALTNHSSMLSTIQSSIGAIGMMTAVGCALSAVNVFQLIKVQKKLSKIEHKIDDGFVDLKNYFEVKLDHLLDHLQKQRLAQAYNYYNKGIEELKTSLLVKDPDNRKLSINNCLSLFYHSISLYDNWHDYKEINLPAKLRKLECCWMLEASIAECRCIQGEYEASLYSYENLYNRIRKDSKDIKSGLTEDNYKFVLGDLDWIYNNDLKILKTKIQLLKDYCKQNISKKYTFTESNLYLQKDIYDNISLPTAHLYLDCFINPLNSERIKEKLIDNNALLKDIKYRYIDYDNLPMIHLCDLYLNIPNENNTNIEQFENTEHIKTKFRAPDMGVFSFATLEL